MEAKLTYEAAYIELQGITADIQSEKITVDVLSEKVKRASHLITFCQDKLRTTEVEVNSIIQQMETNTKLN